MRIVSAIIVAFLWFGVALAQGNARQVISQMLVSEQYDQARDYLLSQSGTEDDHQLLEADIAVAQGQFGKAIKIYRALVARYPRNIGLRAALVKILVVNRNYESAQFHLRELASQSNDPQMREFYFRESQKIGNYKAIGISGSYGFDPSGNINNASDQATDSLFGIEYDLPKEMLPQFGWKNSVNISAFAKSRIGDNLELVLRGSVGLAKYSVPTLDQKNLEIGVGWLYQSARNTIGLTTYFQRNLGDGEAYQIADIFGEPYAKLIYQNENASVLGVRLYAERRYKNAKTLFFSGQLAHERFDGEKLDYAENDRVSLRLGYSYSIDPRNRFTMWVGGQSHVQIGGRKNYISPSNYEGLSIGASLETVYSEGMRTKFGLEVGGRSYEIPPYFSFVDYVREDRTTNASFEISNQKWAVGNFLPKLNCQYSVVTSNFEKYGSRGGTCGINLTQNF